ncbi:amino acid ABC transporter permease [Leucobacter sp. CSA1]|uniref:Amino acid ABC transporter permease n=1 Tax=Leucobacter chromiisoli TaxID=2796471 RepID=A0A934UTN4_9MICO|nr:amino acid ABC transporter permease [Leucobacter chromiisoli]MBK0417905.1 amino acid ABC transporter permease [Leucobacter chromiisoli]
MTAVANWTDPAGSGVDVAHAHRIGRRHPTRWVTGIVVIAIVAIIVYAFATGDIDWPVVGEYFFDSTVLAGVRNVILMTILAMLVGVALGVVVALMRLSANPVLRATSSGFVWVFRGVPQIVQLLIWYNLALIVPYIYIPGIIDERTVDVMSPFISALLGLGLHQAAYASEIIRAGIMSVSRGQIEAAQALAMPRSLMLKRIILPQAMRVIIPPMGNEFITMVKMTSLASVIQYTELLYSAQTIYLANNMVMELLFVVSLWYMVLVTVLSFGQHFLEQRFGRGFQPRTAAKKRTKGIAK